MIRLIVAGGREFYDETLMNNHLDLFFRSNNLSGDGDAELVCGMAKGADLLAKKLFDMAGITVIPFEAKWKDLSAVPCVIKSNTYGQYNVLAGMNRNHEMGDYATHLLAFWDGKSKGTKDMIDYMRKLGKPVLIVRY